MRTFTKALISILAVVLVPVIAALSYCAREEYNFVRRSPLAADLPAKFADASAVFRKRMLEKFTLGSPEGELVKVLSDQGFSSRNAYHDAVWFDKGSELNRSERAPNVLTLTPGPGLNLACRLVWNVAWRSNDAGQITYLYAEHHGICL